MVNWAGAISTALIIHSVIYLNKHIKKRKIINSLILLILSTIVPIGLGLLLITFDKSLVPEQVGELAYESIWIFGYLF